jgi:TIR domain
MSEKIENVGKEIGVPVVFISYSHDSGSHKNWVAELATHLLSNDIEIILDRWDLRIAEDITLFMEQGLAKADRVLVICTDIYITKANSGKGGVGYERMIISAELVKDLGSRKFIPIVRNVTGENKVPRCLGARRYLDFSDNLDCVEEFQELLRDIHHLPPLRPQRGRNPFIKKLPNAIPSALQQIPPKSAMSHDAILKICIRVAEGATVDLLSEIDSLLPKILLVRDRGLAELKPGNLTSGPRRLTASVNLGKMIISGFPFFIRAEDNKSCRTIELDLEPSRRDVASYEYRPSGNLSEVPLTVLLTREVQVVIAFREQVSNPQTLLITFEY